jgi:hypothetical protein
LNVVDVPFSECWYFSVNILRIDSNYQGEISVHGSIFSYFKFWNWVRFHAFFIEFLCHQSKTFSCRHTTRTTWKFKKTIFLNETSYRLIITSIKTYYYLFKKFLVSDWLAANCEIVISTQWLTKYGFFTFILAKWRQRVNMKKIWTRLRHITMTTSRTRIILTRWRHWYDDDDDGCRRTKELFFS